MEIDLGSPPPLLGVAAELFFDIVKDLPKIDLLHLMQTCRGLKYSTPLSIAMFTDLFTKQDLPGSPKSRWLFHAIVNRLDPSNGHLVHRTMMHMDAVGEHIDILQSLCHNLHEVDFTMVMDRIDRTDLHCRLLRISSSRGCPTTCDNYFHYHGRFCFRDSLTHYPAFFQRLNVIAVRYAGSGEPDRGEQSLDRSGEYSPGTFGSNSDFSISLNISDPDDDWLSRLLDTCTNLESLELYRKPNVHKEEHGGSYWKHPWVFYELIESLKHAPKLSTLKLNGMAGVLRNQFLFLESLSPNITNVVISLSADLARYGSTWIKHDEILGRGPNLLPREIQVERASLNRMEKYLEALRRAIDQRGRRFQLSDSEDDHAIRPLKFSFDKRPQAGFDPAHLSWLKQELDWKPIFAWADNVHLAYRRTNDNDEAVANEQLSVCREIFQAVKDCGLRVTLKVDGEFVPPGEDGTLFAGVSSYYADIPFATFSDWHFDSIGDLVDELRLSWGNDFPSEWREGLLSEEDRYAIYRSHDLDRPPLSEEQQKLREATIETRLAERYELERKLATEFFEALSGLFPNLTCLKLRIPAYIYKSNSQCDNSNEDAVDNQFVSRYLPGDWIVQRGNDEQGRYLDADDRRVYARGKAEVPSEVTFLNRTITRKSELA